MLRSNPTVPSSCSACWSAWHGRWGMAAPLLAGSREPSAGSRRCLAPFRNVHKFDPVLRLPLTLGLAHVLAVAAARARETMPAGGSGASVSATASGWPSSAVTVLGVVAVAGAAPGTHRPAGSDRRFRSVPPYWHRTVDWLEENSGAATGTTALLVPGSSFATYLWGTPEDEPVQALARRGGRYATRCPWRRPGTSGCSPRSRPGSRPVSLGRLGRVPCPRRDRHLVVRNDLRGVLGRAAAGPGAPGDRGLAGAARVAAFGPDVGGPVRRGRRGRGARGPVRRVVAEAGRHAEYPAVEVYEVDGAEGAAATAEPPLVVGGPESLLDLLDAGVIGGEPAVLAVDHDEASAPDGNWCSPTGCTPGARLRSHGDDRISHAAPPRTQDAWEHPSRDYLLEPTGRWETTAQLLGAPISSRPPRGRLPIPRARCDPRHSLRGVRRALTPRGSRARRCRGSRRGSRCGSATSRAVTSVTLVAGVIGGTASSGCEGDGCRHVRRTTPCVRSEPVAVELPPGETQWLRVAASPGSDEPASWRSPRCRSRAWTSTAPWCCPRCRQPGAPPTSGAGGRTDPGRVRRGGDDVRCTTGRATGERRAACSTGPCGSGPGAVRRVGHGRPVMGDALLGLIQKDQLLNARASSVAVDDARASAVAAIDGTPGTTWVADLDDRTPRCRWPGSVGARSTGCSCCSTGRPPRRRRPRWRSATRAVGKC